MTHVDDCAHRQFFRELAHVIAILKLVSVFLKYLLSLSRVFMR